jgi:hypothetical protein
LKARLTLRAAITQQKIFCVYKRVFTSQVVRFCKHVIGPVSFSGAGVALAGI